MNVNECIEYIHSLSRFGKKAGLDNIRMLLEYLGNPQDELKCIHVAGTNGKGSTSYLIANVLKYQGYKVGLFTSPFIECFNERIRLNGENISDDDLVKYTLKVKSAVEYLAEKGYFPIEFEVITAIAFLYYKEQNCDYVVLETGLGGRYDSTNIIKSNILSVITNIGIDHTNILGETIEEISYQKAGIIKENSDVVLYPMSDNVYKVINDYAYEMNAVVTVADLSALEIISDKYTGSVFNYKKYKKIHLSLVGTHQIYNAITALEALDVLSGKIIIDMENIYKAFENASWSVRFEVFNKNVLVVIDGAHNLQGVTGFANSFDKYFPDKKKTLIVGMLNEKQYKKSLDYALKNAEKVIVTSVPSARQTNVDDVYKYAKSIHNNVEFIEDNFDAFSNAYKHCDDNSVIGIFGSLYLAGNMRGFVENF